MYLERIQPHFLKQSFGISSAILENAADSALLSNGATLSTKEKIGAWAIKFFILLPTLAVTSTLDAALSLLFTAALITFAVISIPSLVCGSPESNMTRVLSLLVFWVANLISSVALPVFALVLTVTNHLPFSLVFEGSPKHVMLVSDCSHK